MTRVTLVCIIRVPKNVDEVGVNYYEVRNFVLGRHCLSNRKICTGLFSHCLASIYKSANINELLIHKLILFEILFVQLFNLWIPLCDVLKIYPKVEKFFRWEDVTQVHDKPSTNFRQPGVSPSIADKPKSHWQVETKNGKNDKLFHSRISHKIKVTRGRCRLFNNAGCRMFRARHRICG